MASRVAADRWGRDGSVPGRDAGDSARREAAAIDAVLLDQAGERTPIFPASRAACVMLP